MIWAIVIILIVAVIAYGFANESADKKRAAKRKEALDVKIKELPNQQILKKVVGEKGRYAFIFDNIGRKIYFLSSHLTKEIAFADIISVEIFEDNTLLYSKSTSRTVGGVSMEGAGMVVGGMFDNSKRKKKVSEVSVNIRVRDYSTPTFLIKCFNAYELTAGVYKEIKTDNTTYSPLYQTELKNAQKISDYISVIIDEVDKEEKQSSGSQQQTAMANGFVADELFKLAKLKERGILTEEEFVAQKKLLLGGNAPSKNL